MDLEQSPEFWEWVIRKERGELDDNDITGDDAFAPLPLYIEIEKPSKVEQKEEKEDGETAIDFVIYEL